MIRLLRSKLKSVTEFVAERVEDIQLQQSRTHVSLLFFSTPAVIEYKNKLPSNKKGRMAQEMRQRFAEITEEKALMLHDALEAKERSVLWGHSWENIR